MDDLYEVLRFMHFMSFVFMTVPLFNLIIVNERAALGTSFDYNTDRYMENIIRNSASRCFVFQSTVMITGVMLLIFGGPGIDTLWTNWVILTKTILLAVLMILLSHVHFNLQPKIESLLSGLTPESDIPPDLGQKLKPYRVQRKWLATLCLFLVITIIILGMQVYNTLDLRTTAALIVLAALFALNVNRTLIRFGWV